MLRFIIFISFITFISCDNSNGNDSEASIIKNYPIINGAGAATIWNNDIYVFGGSNNYSGDSVYNTIYRFKNNNWELFDTLPDYSNWDLKLLQNGDNAYIVSGWPDNEGVIKKYNFPTKSWTHLTSSININDDYGTSIAMLNNKIYHFDRAGQVDEYDITTNQWTLKTNNPNLSVNDEGLSSVVYQNTIYISGYGDSLLYNYNPALDKWNNVSKLPKAIQGSAMVIINDVIYYAGGEEYTESFTLFDEIYSYSISTTAWETHQEKLHTAIYYTNYLLKDKSLIIIGGIDINDDALNIVQEIILE